MRAVSQTIGAVGILILAIPAGVDSCAIGPPEPVFATRHRPADIPAFLKGRLGVIRPSFQRQYLIGAYRVLSGAPISGQEAQSLYLSSSSATTDRLFVHPELDQWEHARFEVAATNQPLFNGWKAKSADGHFWYFENCLSDAFRSARLTLEKREALWGKNDPRTKEWAAAQQQVFGNCDSRPESIPSSPVDGMDPLLAQDRAYQIASAWFYATDWQKARDAFAEIAREPASPWWASAPYLIARTYVREGTVEDKQDALREAGRLLRAIIADPASTYHDAASRLLDYVRLRIDPSVRLAELGTLLIKPDVAPNFASGTTDFLYLYRRETNTRAADKVSMVASTSDLADWMLEFENRAPISTSHSFEQWQKTGSSAWLIAALSHIGKGSDPVALIAAAWKIPLNSPAYESASYYGLLKEIDAGRRDDAIQWADEILQANLTASARNLVRAERFRLSRNWDEFLLFATRVPEPKLQNDDGSEENVNAPPVPTRTAPLLDEDGTNTLNRRVPLALWVNASQNAMLPPHLQLEIAEAGWVRAILLGRHREAKTLMNRIRQLQPASVGVTQEYVTENDPDRAHFDAIFLILRRPLLKPVLLPVDGNPANLTQVSDSGAGNFGSFASCAWSSSFQTAGGSEPAYALPAESPFLSADERKQGEEEWNDWNTKARTGATYLGIQTLLWAHAHADDPRVPEALHLTVQAGRRGCKDADTGTYSRQAFELLHRRYPQSQWTAQTRYWYK